MNKRNWIITAALLLLVGVVAFSLNLTRTKSASDESKAETAEKQRDRLQEACASNATYDRLKQVLFEEAIRVRNGNSANLDTLAASSAVRMERPLVKSRDEDLNVTVCTGTFILELPPGAERGFGGERRLSADIEYAAQAALDGSGLVYQMDGAEPIIYRLAIFGLQSGGQPQLVTAPQPSAPPGAPPQIVAAEPAVPPVAPPPPPAARPVSEEVTPAPVREVRRSTRPSFNCARARTRSERLVCSSEALASRDRAMSSLFYSAIADADPATRRRIRSSRDAFLARRERCSTEACVANVYEDRIAEIRRMASGD